MYLSEAGGFCRKPLPRGKGFGDGVTWVETVRRRRTGSNSAGAKRKTTAKSRRCVAPAGFEPATHGL